MQRKGEEKLIKVLKRFNFKEILRSRAIESKFGQENVLFFGFFLKMRENKSRFIS